MPVSRIASRSSTYGRASRNGRRREEVRPVEEGRIDLVQADEPRDLDRPRRVALLDRLEIRLLDEHELALRDLPALHDLVLADLPVVNRTTASA